MASPQLHRRFWFPVPGHLGIGVTAGTLEDAVALAGKAAAELKWTFDASTAIVDVDISTLDQNHVTPNMKPPVWPGVWFPMGF